MGKVEQKDGFVSPSSLIFFGYKWQMEQKQSNDINRFHYIKDPVALALTQGLEKCMHTAAFDSIKTSDILEASGVSDPRSIDTIGTSTIWSIGITRCCWMRLWEALRMVWHFPSLFGQSTVFCGLIRSFIIMRWPPWNRMDCASTFTNSLIRTMCTCWPIRDWCEVHLRSNAAHRVLIRGADRHRYLGGRRDEEDETTILQLVYDLKAG